MKISLFPLTSHLDENQLMPPDVVCRFCESKKRFPVALLQDHPRVLLMECHNCHVASASRIPTLQALEDYYKKYYDYSLNFKERFTFNNAKRLARHFISRIRNYLDKHSIDILDFGGGDGSISVETANQLLRTGIEKVNVMLVDYNDILTKVENRNISLQYERSLNDLSNATYDFIIASAILEHVPELKSTLIQLLNLLNEGGIFYARTPYVLPFIKLLNIIGVHWDFMYPAHLHDLGPDFWNTFLDRLSLPGSFEVIESKPSIAELSLKEYFFRSSAALICKAPWYLLRNNYKFVGGWEVFIRKRPKTIT